MGLATSLSQFIPATWNSTLICDRMFTIVWRVSYSRIPSPRLRASAAVPDVDVGVCHVSDSACTASHISAIPSVLPTWARDARLGARGTTSLPTAVFFSIPLFHCHIFLRTRPAVSSIGSDHAETAAACLTRNFPYSPQPHRGRVSTLQAQALVESLEFEERQLYYIDILLPH